MRHWTLRNVTLSFKKIFCKKFKEKRKFWSLVISYRGKGKKRIYAYRRTSTMVQKSVTSKDFGFAQRSYSCKISREVKRLQSLFIQSFQKLCLKITYKSLILKFSNIFLKNRLFRFVLRNSKLKGKGGKSKLWIFEVLSSLLKDETFLGDFQNTMEVCLDTSSLYPLMQVLESFKHDILFSLHSWCAFGWWAYYLQSKLRLLRLT